MATLVILQGSGAGGTHDVERSAIIGRQKGVAVRIGDAGASREHCKVFKQDGDWFVIDLQSRNGTIVNGRKITRQQIYHGDTIRIGETEIRFAAPEAVQAPSAPAPAAAPSAPTPAAPPPSAGPRGPSVMDRERERLRAESAAKAGRTSGGAVDDGSGIVVKEEVLQYGRVEQKGGFLKEDVAQRGGLYKIIMTVLLIGAFVGIVYGMVQLVATDPEDVVDEDTAGEVVDDGSGDVDGE